MREIPSPGTKTAIGYVRVSTERQATQGVSLDMQKQQISLYCQLNGLALSHVYEDAGESGKSFDGRPDAQLAIAHAMEQRCTLIVYSISRFSRRLRDLLATVEQIQKAGGEFVSLTEKFDTSTPVGKLLMTIIGAVAEFEREQIVQRIRESQFETARQGKITGRNPPFGFRALPRNDEGDVMVTPNVGSHDWENRAQIVDWIKAGLAIQGVINMVKQHGIKRSNGNPLRRRDYLIIARYSLAMGEIDEDLFQSFKRSADDTRQARWAKIQAAKRRIAEKEKLR